MDNQNDKEFADVIVSIAALRPANRSVSIDVASFFKPMADRLSLAELRNYIARRFNLKKGTSPLGSFEYVRLTEREIKSFDKRFLWKDNIVLGFRYSADWTTITKLFCHLSNDQL